MSFKFPSPAASALAVITLAALVSCGRGQEGKGNAASPATPPATARSSPSVSVDPCSLVTKAEAEAFFGAALTGPESENASGSRTCTYKNASGNVLVTSVSDSPSSKAALEQFGALIKARTVSSVGDAAIEGPIGTISFVKGSTLYAIDAGISRWGGEKLLSLAKTAANRL